MSFYNVYDDKLWVKEFQNKNKKAFPNDDPSTFNINGFVVTSYFNSYAPQRVTVNHDLPSSIKHPNEVHY